MSNIGFIKTQTTTKKETSNILVKETFTHSIAFGQTGCGKTSGFIYTNLKNRLSLGHGVLLYDYKGKEHLSVKVLAQHTQRLQDVVEIGKPWGKSINLIQNMDEDELDKFFENILSHGEDNKYWENSAKALGQTLLKILHSFEEYSNTLEKLTGEAPQDYIVTSSFKYPTKRTLASLVEICATFETLTQFIKGLSELKESIKDEIIMYSKKLIHSHEDMHKYRADIFNVIASQEKLFKTLQSTKTSLENFGADSNENLTQNIIGSLISPLLSLAQNPLFNTNDFDIVTALNNKKVVVVNVESLSNTVIESLNNTILYELSKRTKSLNINPISVFIDEVQRVMSENTDLPIDIFREAKVDMFLATQNSALLKDKLKEEKFEALMGNLTQKFYFLNSNDEELDTLHDICLLENFQYLSSGQNYKNIESVKPIFIKDNMKLKVEYYYQKKLQVLQKYLYEHKEKEWHKRNMINILQDCF